MRQGQLFSASESYPVMMTPDADRSVDGLRAYVTTNLHDMNALLLRHGGILFRGFDLQGADDFRACAESLGATPYGYVGGTTPRSQVAMDVFTSTEYPATEVIPLHNEMSYLPARPRRLFFYSLVPADHGGQTPIASSRDVLRALPADLIQRLRDKRITYIRHFHPSFPLGKSWQTTYQTTDRDEVERIVARQGSTCSWLSGDVLRVATSCDALATHPVTGEEVWFNQAELWHPSSLAPYVRAMFEELVGRDRLPHDCTYGDGDPLEDSTLAEIRRALAGNKLLFDWRAHDLLMLDNVLMMHGREPFKGERKTLAYLSAT